MTENHNNSQLFVLLSTFV